MMLLEWTAFVVGGLEACIMHGVLLLLTLMVELCLDYVDGSLV